MQIFDKYIIPKSRLILISATLFIAVSCSTTKYIPITDIKPMPASKIVRKVESKKPIYQNYVAKKVSIDFENDENSGSFSGQFKIKRNKSILFSIKKMSVPLGKVFLTQDSLFLINYFDRSYIADDIAKIQDLIGIDLDYNLLQALLTADISKILEEETIDKDLISTIDSQMYRIDSQLNPRISKAISTGNDKRLSRYMKRMDDSEFLNYSLWVDPQYFIIKKLVLKNIKSKEDVTINFSEYELVGRSLFPQQLLLEYFSPKQKMKVEINLSKLSVKPDNDFTFNIPDKYEKMKLSGSK